MKKVGVRTIFSVVGLMLLLNVGSMGCIKTGVKMMAPKMVEELITKIQMNKSARLVKEGLPGQVLLMASITEMAPDNIKLLTNCAFAYCAYGMFIEDEDPEYAMEMYLTGKEYGLRALKQDGKFCKGLASGKKISELTETLGKKYMEALCWTAMNAGLWIMLNIDDPEAQMQMADTIGLITRSIKLDENYFHGVGKTFLGGYYSFIPEFLGLGGGPDNAAKMFKKARKVTNGKLLLVDVFEARYLATSLDDEEKFDRLLKFVVETKLEGAEGLNLMNALAKKKAKIFIEHKDEYF